MNGNPNFKKETMAFIDAIKSFFSLNGVSYHLNFLKNWLNPPQNEFDFSPQKHPAKLLVFYEKLVPLFDYSDLIFNRIESDTAFVKAIGADECGVERETVLLDYCPKLLSIGEMQNPNLTFFDIFLFLQSDTYKVMYKEWLLAALENNLDLDWDEYIFMFYENTKKMLEACWLIHERIITKNSFKSIDHYYHMAIFESTSPLAFEPELLQDPFKAIEFFFSLDNLTGHKAYLKNWYKAALAEEQCLSNVADYFFLYNQFTKLLNAGYLITAKKLIYQGAPPEGLPPAAAHSINGGTSSKERCEVNTLAAEHIANPYLFVASLFIPEKIKQLRLGLLEWLYAAFSTRSSIKLMDKEFLFEQYEAMMMMMEAFFVMISDPTLSESDESDYYAE
ncbi:hypothetical protein [Pedobacter zeae]|uniref:Uncharacterized protein n=1 Tax=Pedobacter zeae TaxID=1737356 RepID=A0A7W6K962_9SPHI|nr:hypothetical protein [Pedobacter zeae]MBB4107516.1 hypothetical protein [Pedobacter zeae]GGG98856.1 hypothetical protein GCM10007422_11300 [Pedobacter zeae]